MASPGQRAVRDHAFSRRTKMMPATTITVPHPPEPRTRFTHLSSGPESPPPRLMRESTSRMPMAMSVLPIETRRKPRNSATSLIALDHFMGPIVAGKTGYRLETLVPIVKAVTRDRCHGARNLQALPDCDSIRRRTGRPSRPVTPRRTCQDGQEAIPYAQPDCISS